MSSSTMEARTLVLAVLATSGVACSLLVDTEGLTHTVSDAGAVVNDSGDGRGEGGGVDGAAPDSATPLDDGSVAPDRDAGADAAPPRFCVSLPPPKAFRFCADFDGPNEDGGPAAEWDGLAVADGGALALDTKHVASPPRALRATTTTGDSPRVFAKGPAASARVTVDFDFVAVTRSDTGQAVCVLAIQQNDPNFGTLLLYMNGDIIYGQTNGSGPSPQFSTNGVAPPAGAWRHATYVLDLKANSITVIYDGVKLFDATANAHPWSTTADFTILAGLPFAYQVTSADVVIDNVVVDVE